MIRRETKTRASSETPPTIRRRGPGLPSTRLLAGLRIRLKLIVLHTVFSLLLAGVLWLALRPAIAEIIRQAETHEASVILATVLAHDADAGLPAAPGVTIRTGTPEMLRLPLTDDEAYRIVADREPLTTADVEGVPTLTAFDPRRNHFVQVTVELAAAREAVNRLYLLLYLALGLVYALVAAALELFVLPQHVYGPIRTMLSADLALREGRRDEELIPAAAIPADELGEIMTSRNESVLALRRHEEDLAEALQRLEEVATDLARKNHLLETARRNMAESDRLASLGLMSAGIAHELNTPLAVLKGMVEKLHTAIAGRGIAGAAFKSGTPTTAPVSADEAALMVRVVGRLERLSESLLDFARARPAVSVPTTLTPLIEDAWTLVRLDRDAQGVKFESRVPPELKAVCDPDRMVQVLVNLLRNAVDAMSSPVRTKTNAEASILVDGAIVVGPSESPNAVAPERFASITITDTGPGIDAALISRLFEPFVSTRLDAKGTGLGLAVAEGIVKEHGGKLLARNRGSSPSGAVFEILLPLAG